MRRNTVTLSYYCSQRRVLQRMPRGTYGEANLSESSLLLVQTAAAWTAAAASFASSALLHETAASLGAPSIRCAQQVIMPHFRLAQRAPALRRTIGTLMRTRTCPSQAKHRQSLLRTYPATEV